MGRLVSELPARSAAVLSLIGNTPLVPLVFQPDGVMLYAKCEFLNPSGSIKDRFARMVILDAETRGLLRPDSIILECAWSPSSATVQSATSARVCSPTADRARRIHRPGL